ncbi:Uncharacterised protein [Segatella copri]|nr:Uncharacterised protein [Segatella copri]
MSTKENPRVSIHTPTKGVTNTFRKNPYFSYVSIHTPTKGVTYCSCVSMTAVCVSIHTPTKGVTCLFFGYPEKYRFQSTHPRRV